jgi:hypothetical protein
MELKMNFKKLLGTNLLSQGYSYPIFDLVFVGFCWFGFGWFCLVWFCFVLVGFVLVGFVCFCLDWFEVSLKLMRFQVRFESFETWTDRRMDGHE